MSIPGLAMFSIAGYKDVAYSPHFEDDIGKSFRTRLFELVIFVLFLNEQQPRLFAFQFDGSNNNKQCMKR